MTNEMIEVGFGVLLTILGIGILVVFILLIIAVFKIQENTRQAAANVVITNKKLVEIRQLLEQNFGETQAKNTTGRADAETRDAGEDDSYRQQNP